MSRKHTANQFGVSKQAPAAAIGVNDKFTEPVVAYRRNLADLLVKKGLGQFTGDLRYMAYGELVAVTKFMGSPAFDFVTIGNRRLRQLIEHAQAEFECHERCIKAQAEAAAYTCAIARQINEALRVPMSVGADIESPYDYLAIDIEPCGWFACIRR